MTFENVCIEGMIWAGEPATPREEKPRISATDLLGQIMNSNTVRAIDLLRQETYSLSIIADKRRSFSAAAARTSKSEQYVGGNYLGKP